MGGLHIQPYGQIRPSSFLIIRPYGFGLPYQFVEKTAGSVDMFHKKTNITRLNVTYQIKNSDSSLKLKLHYAF